MGLSLMFSKKKSGIKKKVTILNSTTSPKVLQFERPQGPHAMLIVHTVTPPPAKRRKSEKAVPSGVASSSKSPAKSKRTGVSRRIQGRLQNMLSLPFDVLFLVCPYQPESHFRPLPNEPLSQIFSELRPMDLVNLARTNKALRGVFMSRESIWVWLVARRNAGATKVPDPPDD